ncbi:hypothetical protein MCC01954_11250 [Bifidobacteriaceae bacterium MCC01954]|nr:hypothetical protein MCC01954_11250 [Bifidobacteriaceae bacterium MCC01954]
MLCRLIRKNTIRIKIPHALAHDVGYADPKYFMRVFKRRTGLTPGQYRDAFPACLYNTV